ncbi:MAG TPA: arginine decarboxylase [Vicinamibacteria bacterium]|nr:arginine decarboxylase [Vicinamibacteria bacterium]
MQTFYDFLAHSFEFPPEGFQVIDDELYFHGINMMELIETYKTPVRFTYLPIISENIRKARLYFEDAMKKYDYRGKYIYCYCTKSSHFKHVMVEVLKSGVQLETSSALDMPIIDTLERTGYLSKETFILCNGFKDYEYKQHIVDMLHDGFFNIVPILDNKEELNFYEHELEVPCSLGIRMATEEPPVHSFYTSRLGMREDDIIPFYEQRLARQQSLKLRLLHFFVHTGMHDTPFFWSELRRFVSLYCRLKKVDPDLEMLDIGGGLPFRNSLGFEFDYAYVVQEIVRTIKEICTDHNVEEPTLVTEFGSFTVAESSGALFKVLSRKQQNDREKWFMIDGSIISMLPDVWALSRRFITLPINNWGAGYEKVSIGGMTCDGDDFYNEEAHLESIFMPATPKQQYIGFFHTGAYQEVLSGVGGLHHCLMPDPKHVVISVDEEGARHYRVLHEEQSSKQVLRVLGYRRDPEAPPERPSPARATATTHVEK